jgi:ribosome-associated protein
MKEPSRRSLKLSDRPINLTQVLKLAGCVQSGGEAKAVISAGAVRVNGEIELRKRRKLKAGDIVLVEDRIWVELTT